MAYFKRTQSKFSAILFSRGIVLVLILGIAFVGYGLFSLIGKSIQASDDRKLAESQAADAQTKETALSAQLAAVQTPEGQEAALREALPVVKPGEHLIMVVDDNSDSDDSQTPSPKAPSGFWNFFKKIF